MRFAFVILIGICSFSLSAQVQRQMGTNKPNLNGPGNMKPFEHAEGTYVVVNGINMYYEQYGEGDPVLLIHGNGGSVKDMDAQINYLARKHRVIVADSRGQGNSGNNADSLTYELMTEDYYLLLEQLELDSVMVFGWSDGAIIGLLLARDYPGKVSRLAISGANLRSDTTALIPEILSLAAYENKKAKDSIAAGNKSFIPARMLTQLVLHHPDIDAASLSDIQIPVLVISGDNDLVKLEHTMEIYSHLPNAQLCIFPGTTHHVLQEVPQLLNNALSRFFLKPFVKPDPMGTVLSGDSAAGEE